MHLLKQRKHIDKKVLILLLITLVWFIANDALEFTFPTYLEELSKSYLEIGFLLSLASVSGMLIDLPMGNLSDKMSRKRLMISGLGISIIATVLIFSLKSNLFLSCIFLLWGLGFQVWKVPRDAKFAALTNANERAELYGLDVEIKYLAHVVGSILGGLLLLYMGFNGVINFYIISLVVAILLIFLLIKEKGTHKGEHVVRDSVSFKAIVKELREISEFGVYGAVLLYFTFLLTFWEGLLWAFEPLFYGPDVLNIPPHLGGLLLAFFAIPGLLLAYPSGKIADKYGKRKVLFLSLIMMGVSLILFSKASTLILVFLAALLVSTGWVIALPSLNGLIVNMSHKQRKGTLVGVWNLFMDIGYILGPLLGGIIAHFFGIKNIFLVVGVLIIFSSFLILFVKGDFRRSRVSLIDSIVKQIVNKRTRKD